MNPDLRIDELLANATWVRRLAQHLLGDRGLADDVVQDTWLAALRGAPRGSRLRPWLARVARNFALQRRRSETAHDARERAVARTEPTPSAAETVARAELHARLVHAVLALAEPYRATVLWRYFDELTSEEIARRAGIDPATVRSRIARARQRLAEELRGRDGGDPAGWLAVLAAGEGAAKAHGMTSLAWVGVACLALGGLWSWRELAAPGAAIASRELAAAANEAPARVGPDRAADATPGRRAVTSAGGDVATRAGAEPLLVQGVVTSEDGGLPLAGARIAHRIGSEIEASGPDAERTTWLTRTDANGRFVVERPASIGTGLWIEHDGHFPQKVDHADLPRDATVPATIVLAPLGVVELCVTDVAGGPVADAAVVYNVELTRGAVDQRWRHRSQRLAGRTDAAGMLTMTGLPCGMSIRLACRHALEARRETSTRVTVPVAEKRARATLRLDAPAAVFGRLVGADGRPMAEQTVAWHEIAIGVMDPVRAATGADGRFRLASLTPATGELRVQVPGFQPVVLALRGGETRDVGDVAVPLLLPVTGRLVSRFGSVDEDASVCLYRDGERIATLQPVDGAFSTRVTPGTVDLMVVRGEPDEPRAEILARRTLVPPATDVAIDVDAGRGGIAMTLGSGAGPDAETVSVSALAVEGTQLRYSFAAERHPDARRRVVIGPLAPGRHRVRVAAGPRVVALSAELTVVAGAVTEAGVLEFANGIVAGSVVDAQNRPVARAAVRLRGDGLLEVLSADDGRFRFAAVTAGLWSLEARQGDLGSTVPHVVTVAPNQTTEARLVLAGFVTLLGSVRSPHAPLPGVTVFVQPKRSNDVWNATTDGDGRFRIDRLPSGHLRVWSGDRFMQVLDVAPGATRELDVVLAPPHRLRFVREGRPLVALHSVAAIAVDRSALVERQWLLGRVIEDEVEIPSLAGPMLFVVGCRQSGADAVYAVVVPRASDVIEVGGRSIRVQGTGPWRGPLPVASLVSVDGTDVVSSWGTPVVLACELDADGRPRVPCLPAGAVVRLRGQSADGGAVDLSVAVTHGVTDVRWPE